MNNTQAKVIEIIAKSPLTLADLIAAAKCSWVDVCQALDPLIDAGVIGETEPPPLSMAMPIYYLNS